MKKLKDYYRKSVVDLEKIINSIYMFKNIGQCEHFLTDVENEKDFLVISSSLPEQIRPTIENISQIDSISVTVDNHFGLELSVKK